MSYLEVDEFFHSSEHGGGSDPDNQNKSKVLVDLGIDAQTGERLYDLHERRAQRGSMRALFAIFRASQFATRLRQRTRCKDMPNGAKVGWRQFLESKCKCIQERKPSECDCQDCTYITNNLARWNRARRGWHQALLERAGGSPCTCYLHGIDKFEEVAKEACEAEAEAWALAADCAAEESNASNHALMSSIVAKEAEAALHAARDRKRRYDAMSSSPSALVGALLQCKSEDLPEYTVTGERSFRLYSRECARGNCPNLVFRASNACGWDRQFGLGCPIDVCDEPFTWHVWEQRVRGTRKDDGQPSYSPEFVPKHGTRREFLSEFRSRVAQWIPHQWRDRLGKQGLRVFEDRKSGRHLNYVCANAARAKLLSDALHLVAKVNPQCCHKLHVEEHNDSALAGLLTTTEVWAMHSFANTLAAMSRIAALDAKVALKLAIDAKEVHASASRTATVQSDYAAQLETRREYTATCASRERHNFLVTIVGYKPYTQDVSGGGSRRKKPAAQLEEYRQVVDVFFAFHVAGCKV